jgi:predicted protein tyrosine phosphatase
MKLSIGNYDQAGQVLQTEDRGGITHLISINDPGQVPPEGVGYFPGPRLVLAFNDTPTYYDEPSLHGLLPPHPADVRRIIDFSNHIQRDDAHVLVHCGEGRSRSAAAVLTILASRETASQEAAAKVMADLLKVKAFVMPNEPMVHYADEALGWNRLLFAAYRRTFKAGAAIWTPPQQ